MAKKLVIIGGGVAGLSAGIYGQLNGFETEILEMHTIPGGQCTAWERKGYRFDYCLHWLVGTAGGVFHELWKETNVINDQTVIVDHDVHTRMINRSGDEFMIYTDIARWEKYLIGMAPYDEAAIRKLCRNMRKAASYEPLDETDGLRGMFSNAKKLIRMMPLFPVILKYGKKSCREYFNELGFKDPKLTYFLDKMFGDRNFSALAFIMMLGWFDQKNAGYIVGGSLPLARRMEEKYRSLGGKLSTGKRVVKIIVEENAATGVELSDGTVLNAGYVISAADGHATIFDMLGGRYVSKEIKYAYENWDLFTPLVQVSFGINTRLAPEYPSQSFVSEGMRIGSTELEYGYSLMNYSFDPTMAPEGKTVVVLRFESPWDIWKGMNAEEYNTEKEKIRKDAVTLLELHYPGISENTEVTDVATPLTCARYTGVWKGAYEGFMPSPGNIAKSLKNTLPGLKRFYMAGQWLFPGGGLPPSVLSAKIAVKQICSVERRRFKTA